MDLKIIETYLFLFLRYSFFYLYLFLFGKFVFSIILKFTNEKKQVFKLLYVKPQILFPLIGLVLLGNILLIYNFFLPLKHSHILLGAIFIFSLSTINFKLSTLKIKDFIRIDNLFSYLIIPGILVVSTYDTNYNFDAGFYHIPNQNWIRESNIIVGFVNIFWELGISSIYEYISASLWIDGSFTLLHLLNVYFIHFFYLFLKENILQKEDQILINISLFILVFSIFDNFGFGGGRNGFIYIQGVTKQDVTVGILFWFLSIVIMKKIIDKNIESYEVLMLSILTFFLFQIKVSGVFIFIIYLVLLTFTLKSNSISFNKLLYLHIPVLLIGIIWFLKNLLTTGCFIFPLNITCLNIFDWYVDGSTLMYEIEAIVTSQPYDFSIPFNQWIFQTGSFEVRRQIFLNFSISIVILYSLKILFFKSYSQNKEFNIICFTYIALNTVYLFFFGPIPRYFIGINLFIVSTLGFYAGKSKFQISRLFKYSLIFISVFLLVKFSSYKSLFSGDEFRIFDPRINEEIIYESISSNWVMPVYELQCWANTKCIPRAKSIIFQKKGIFLIAYNP